MRIALIAPPWYTIPPSGYGGIEWVVALLADGLTDRGHEVTLFAAPGSDTRARLVSPLHEEPPRDAIGDPWYEASHVVSVYEHGDQFDILHDHTGPVGVSVGALSNCPTIHYNGIPMDRYPFREAKDDYLFFLGRADEEKASHLAIQAARQAGRRLMMCATTKNERERGYWAANVEPILGDDVEVHGECPHEHKADLLARASALLFPIQWPEPFGLVMTEAMACGTPVVAWRNGSVPEVVADGQTGFIVSSVDGLAMVAGYEGAHERAVAGEQAAAG
jgi:glycosyltransferase involved in cell wall biosynthesis